MSSFSTGLMQGFILASLVAVLAGVFAYRQWVERSNRETDLSEADLDHFTRKDRRRLLGSAVLALIAVGMFVGLMLLSQARGNRLMARMSGYVWIGVCVLLCVSLILAMLDWVANRVYAVRHGRALAEERRAFFEEQIRQRSAARNGRAGPTELS